MNTKITATRPDHSVSCTPILIDRARITLSASHGFVWILCGNVVYAACQWAFVIVLARAGSMEDLGVYALGLAISTPLLIFANCQGRNLVASDVVNRHTFSEYLQFRMVSLPLALAAALAIVLKTAHTYVTVIATSLLGISLAFDWISETAYGLLQKHDRLDLIGQSLILKGPLCLLFLSAMMALTHNIVWAAAGLAAGRGLTLWLFDLRNAARTGELNPAKFDHSSFLPQLRSALPLGIISALGAVNTNIPRYFIESNLSTRNLGIFAAAASLAGAGNLVMSALANSSFVGIARAVATGDRLLYRRLSGRLILMAAALGAAGVLISRFAGRQILSTLFRPEYGASADVLTPLMLAGGVNYIVSGQGYVLTAARVLRQQIPIVCIATLATAIFCRWLVPVRGIVGAAEASVLSSVVGLVLSSLIMIQARVANRTPHTLGAIQ